MSERYKYDTPDLSMMQIKADIVVAEKALKEAGDVGGSLAKYLKGLSGYHLQQATEKLIKIQIYEAKTVLDYSKLYKHNIGDLLFYAESLQLNLSVPPYVYKHKNDITSWETLGRYDIHVVVRIDTLKKCLDVIKEWYEELKK